MNRRRDVAAVVAASLGLFAAIEACSGSGGSGGADDGGGDEAR